MMKTNVLDNIIFKEKFPKANKILQRNITNDDGFEILTKIIFGLSSQLGGIYEDPQELFEKFKIIENEHVTDFYHREVTNSNIIILKNDKTGQENRWLVRDKVPRQNSYRGHTEVSTPAFNRRKTTITVVVFGVFSLCVL